MERWLDKVGPFRVEHVPLPFFHAPIDSRFDQPGERVKGVQHTTEGSTLEGALSAYRSKGFTPTFTLGKDSKGKTRILQHKPLGIMGSTLANAPGGTQTNAYAVVQIELVGFSKKIPWLPDADDIEALAYLYAELNKIVGIPLRKVDARRSVVKWERGAGWFGHADVPENSHWDSGALDYETVFGRANDILRKEDATPPAKLPTWYWPWVEWRLGEGRFKGHKRDPKLRPKAPKRIPSWAWKRLEAFLKARKKPRRTDAVRTLAIRTRARFTEASGGCDAVVE